MTHRLLAGLGAALLATWAIATVPDAKPAGTADDVQDMVLLADGRPVFLRLHIEIDGQPFRTAHAEALKAYLDGLFTQLDSNGDGVLSEDEARRMPSPFKPPATTGGSTVHVAFNYRVVDADGDGKITGEEMAEYHREFSGGAAQVQPAARTPIPPQVDEALFKLLDTNKDGKLSKEELAAAADVLFPLDQDRDELISPQEIAPSLYTVGPQDLNAPVPPPSMGRPAVRTASLFLVSTNEDRAALASALLTRYGRGNRDKLDGHTLGLNVETFNRLDADKDGALDAAELAKFTDRPADAELIVRLGDRAAGLPALAVVAMGGAASTTRTSGDGGLTLTFGGVHLDLRVNAERPDQPAGTRQRDLELFRGAAGAKGRLSADEAQRNGFFPGQFALLDRNGDGELTEREFADYLDGVQDRQARLIGATPSLLLSGRARTLFEWLDRDGDGRLSLRELREAPKLLARMGVDAVSARTSRKATRWRSGQVGRASAGRGRTPSRLPKRRC